MRGARRALNSIRSSTRVPRVSSNSVILKTKPRTEIPRSTFFVYFFEKNHLQSICTIYLTRQSVRYKIFASDTRFFPRIDYVKYFNISRYDQFFFLKFKDGENHATIATIVCYRMNRWFLEAW